jgi:serpin B
VAGLSASLLVVACGAGDSGSARRGDRPFERPDPDAAELVVEPTATLAATLHRALTATHPGNVAVSPLLVLDGLAMVRVGADGASQDELDRLLGTSGLGDDELLGAVAAVHEGLAASEGEQTNETRRGSVRIDLPSSLWLQRGTRLDQTWLDRLSGGLDRPVRLVDFRSDPESARNALNTWAADATGGAISQLAPRGTVTSASRLVVAGAVWLEAPWAAPFPVTETTTAPFTLAGGATVQVTTLHQRRARGFRYGEGDTWQAVELPYLGDDLSMVVVVPRLGGLAAFEAGLDGDRILEVLDALGPAPVEVTVPAFGFTSELQLLSALGDLGLDQITDPERASLDPSAPGELLAVDDVIQQTYVGIDEEGTEESAATATGSAAPIVGDTESVVADEPFLVLVTHRPTGAVVLIGRVSDPRA